MISKMAFECIWKLTGSIFIQFEKDPASKLTFTQFKNDSASHSCGKRTANFWIYIDIAKISAVRKETTKLYMHIRISMTLSIICFNGPVGRIMPYSYGTPRRTCLDLSQKLMNITLLPLMGHCVTQVTWGHEKLRIDTKCSSCAMGK